MAFIYLVTCEGYIPRKKEKCFLNYKNAKKYLNILKQDYKTAYLLHLAIFDIDDSEIEHFNKEDNKYGG